MRQELGGRPLRVSAGPPPRKDDFPSRGSRSISSFNSPNKVYVGNLSWGVDKSTLESLFSEQGKVMDARVVYCRESGRSRGFGFVTYSTAEEVDNAISALNGFVSYLHYRVSSNSHLSLHLYKYWHFALFAFWVFIGRIVSYLTYLISGQIKWYCQVPFDIVVYVNLFCGRHVVNSFLCFFINISINVKKP